MLIETITSRQNPLVKRLVQARSGRARHQLFLEGIRIVEEALRSGVNIEVIAYSPALLDSDRGRHLLDELRRLPGRGAVLTEKLMKAVSDVETPQGIVVLASRPHYDLKTLLQAVPGLLIFADGIQDPGNLGALVRTAEAAGVTGLIATRQSADPFQPKAVRASAGSAFRLPIVTHQSSLKTIEKLRAGNVRLVTASPRGQVHFSEYDWRQPTALWLGSEGGGLDDTAERLADLSLFIPMSGQLESLNVTVASALLLYEAARQRVAMPPVTLELDEFSSPEAQ